MATERFPNAEKLTNELKMSSSSEWMWMVQWCFAWMRYQYVPDLFLSNRARESPCKLGWTFGGMQPLPSFSFFDPSDGRSSKLRFNTFIALNIFNLLAMSPRTSSRCPEGICFGLIFPVCQSLHLYGNIISLITWHFAKMMWPDRSSKTASLDRSRSLRVSSLTKTNIAKADHGSFQHVWTNQNLLTVAKPWRNHRSWVSIRPPFQRRLLVMGHGSWRIAPLLLLDSFWRSHLTAVRVQG